MDKKEIRREIKRKRNEMPKALRRIRSFFMQKRFLRTELYKESKILLAYIATGSEIDTKKIIKRAFKDGKKVYVPLTYTVKEIDRGGQIEVTRNCMDFYAISNLAELMVGNYGILEPVNREEKFDKDHCEHALVLVPGVVFDRKGNRYGYGKGFYDYFLQGLHLTKVGACYEMQILESIPSETFDIKMDYLITEKRLWNI